MYITGTTLNNRFRMRELRSMIVSKDPSPLITDKLENIENEIGQVKEQLSDTVSSIGSTSDTSADNMYPADTDVELLLMNTIEERMIKRMDDFEKELVKVAVSHDFYLLSLPKVSTCSLRSPYFQIQKSASGL